MFTPPRKSRITNDVKDTGDESMLTSTPIQTTKYDDLDSSPIPLTQETEVCWDWSSPRNRDASPVIKKTAHRKHKLNQKTHLSPLLPIPHRFRTDALKSHNLQEQLDALHRELLKKKPVKVEPVKETNNLDDLLEDDDDLLQDLVLCSQQVEKQYLQGQQETVITKNNCVDDNFVDDSFDQILEALDEQEIEHLTQAPMVTKDEDLKFKGGTVTCYPTQLTMASSQTQPSISVPKCTMEEIERKRREALAKRERKTLARPKSTMDIAKTDDFPFTSLKFGQRNQSFEFESSPSTSSPPFQCTANEIERKRLEALARRGRRMFDRSKSNADIDVDEISRKIIKKNYSFEITSPTSSKSSSTEIKESCSDWKNLKEWEKIQEQIEKKRQEALARLKRKHTGGER